MGIISADTSINWVVDPIDGTTNFVHHFPNSCISISLVATNLLSSTSTPLLGVIYHPLYNVVYWAIQSQGAFLEDLHKNLTYPLHMAKPVTLLNKALVATEFGSYESEYQHESSRMLLSSQRNRLCHHPVHGIRCLGSAALNLALLASGQLDLYYQYGIHAWDIAAGILIVQEAGGVVSNIVGPHQSEYFDMFARNVVACSNSKLLQAFLHDIIFTHDVDISDHERLISEFKPDYSQQS